MHHKSRKHDLQHELHNLVDAVAPRIESAVSTVTEKTPPLVDRGREVAGTVADRSRTVAYEKGALLAERLPDGVVERLPAGVVDQLPVRRHRRGRKLLLLGLLGALVAAVAARRSGKLGGTTPGGRHGATQPPASAASSGPVSTGPTAMTTEAMSQPDPADPLVEPHINGRAT